MRIGLHHAWEIGENDGLRGTTDLIALLARIGETGSLAAAARECGLSYRHAWGLLDRWQSRIGQPLVDAKRGSGARLTACADRLIEVDARTRKRLAGLVATACAEMREALADTESARGLRLAIVASHDLALAALRELLEMRGVGTELHFRGSLDSLAALAAGRCDAAGFHCPEGPLGARLWEQYRRLLMPRRHLLWRFCRRTQGLLVRPGNPKRLRRIADLRKPGVRFLNRQPGAGTRLLLDLLLQESGLTPADVPGYASEEHTHAAVAALIANDAADVGLGIEAAARRFGLDFVPLLQEQYFIAGRRDRAAQTASRALAAALRSPEFRASASAMPGYDANRSGEPIALDEVPDLLGSRASAAAPGAGIGTTQQSSSPARPQGR